MRLDKYLKVSRLIKRRTLAKELVELGRAEINGKVAKPSSEIKEGDLLGLHLKDLYLVVKVNKVAEYIRSDEADTLYTVVSEDRKNTENI